MLRSQRRSLPCRKITQVRSERPRDREHGEDHDDNVLESPRLLRADVGDEDEKRRTEKAVSNAIAPPKTRVLGEDDEPTVIEGEPQYPSGVVVLFPHSRGASVTDISTVFGTQFLLEFI